MRRFRFLIAAILVTTGCYGSIEGAGQKPGDTSSPDSAPASGPTKQSPSPPKNLAPNNPQQTESAACEADAAACDQTLFAKSIHITLDGKACATETNEPGNGLSLGLDGDGWQYDVISDDCGFILEIAGKDDAAYPQTSATTFLDQPTVMLFTNESPVDGGVGGTFLTSPGGSAAIESGPVKGVPATIKGSAITQAEGAEAKHEVIFALDF